MRNDMWSFPQLKRLFALAALLLALLLGTSYLAAQDPTHWGGQTEVTHTHDHAAGEEHSDPLVPDEALSGVPCVAGFAGPFPCHNVDLLAYLPDNLLTGSTGADIWGWTDPATGKEYAIVGQSDAVAFVDISTPTAPQYLGYLRAPVRNVLWRDVKVLNNHAYAVGDGDFIDPHGLQIFDLTQLRDAGPLPVEFQQTARYAGFGNAHNMAVNEATNTGYVVGSDTCAGGLHMLDLQDPANPAFLGCFSEDEYTHDVQCVVYDGPDREHAGKEICLAANVDRLTIVDVTDKANPVMLSRTTYEGIGYTHQGSLTEDQAYFILGDELDEVNSYLAGNPHNTHSYLWDVRDLDSPVHFSTYVGPTTAIDHNLYVLGTHVFETNYTAGLRILDASGIGAGVLTEVAYFDTHPSDDSPAFAGTWSNYAFFDSGVVIANNIEDGLFVLQPHLPAAAPAGSKASGGGWLADGDGNKINLGFEAEANAGGTAGDLALNDKAAGVKIDMRVTFLGEVSEPCGSVPAGEDSLELRGSGTYNGSAANFRACVQDNGEPGKGSDRFYLQCTAGTCSYDSSSRVADDIIDAGNVQVRLGAAGEEPADGQPSTLILDPILLSEGLAGTVQSFQVRVFDAAQNPLQNARVTLTRTAADGTSESFTALSGLEGTALFNVANLYQSAAYSATAGSVTSNAVEVDALLP